LIKRPLLVKDRDDVNHDPFEVASALDALGDRAGGDASETFYDYADVVRSLARELIEQRRSGSWWAQRCHGCGSRLDPENAFVDDGCPCNSPRGINFEPAECRICKEPCVKPGHHEEDVVGYLVVSEERSMLDMTFGRFFSTEEEGKRELEASLGRPHDLGNPRLVSISKTAPCKLGPPVDKKTLERVERLVEHFEQFFGQVFGGSSKS
jgi:hypothetical protein